MNVRSRHRDLKECPTGRPIAAERSANRATELWVSSHLMSPDAGLLSAEGKGRSSG
jgi:hypothetical protein